jgi:acyl-CoA dehydrogenase
MKSGEARGEPVATVDETLGLGLLSPNGTDAAEGHMAGGAAAPARCARARGGRHRLEGDEMATAYVSEREQFGKKIGNLPGDLALARRRVRRGRARPLARLLGGVVRRRRATSRSISPCAAAKSQAAEAAVLACETSIQAHGGIGFTWEHPLHRYYKRALWLEGALGYGREHRAEIAASLLSS